MKLVFYTTTRMLGEGLSSCLRARPESIAVFVVDRLSHLEASLREAPPDLVLVDVASGLELIDIRPLALTWPAIPLIAFGLTEIKEEVIKCGRAGFSGYISREASVDSLCKSLDEIVAGKLSCPPEITSGMLRALFKTSEKKIDPISNPNLTRREREVLNLIGRGLTNKEIGRTLCLSVATVKHHVHNLLEKMKLPRRVDAMRVVRDAPWLGTPQSQSATEAFG